MTERCIACGRGVDGTAQVLCQRCRDTADWQIRGHRAVGGETVGVRTG